MNVRALVLGIGAGVLLVGCGGNVIVDAMSGPGGSAGAGGSGLGGAAPDGGPSCASLWSAFQAAHQAAIACDPGASVNVCTVLAPDDCGCPAPANGTGNLAADDEEAYAAVAGSPLCAPACFGCPTPSTMLAQCLPAPGGGQCGEGPG